MTDSHTMWGAQFSPALTITAAGVGVFAPLWFITRKLYRNTVTLSRGGTDLRVEDIEIFINNVSGREMDLSQSIAGLSSDLVEVLFGDATAIVSMSLFVSIGGVLTLFLVYYLLKDGREFVQWLIDTAPMSSNVCDRLFRRIDRTTRGVIIGHLFVAVLQGIVGGVGLLIAGIPNVVFWTFTMIVLAMLPVIGAFLVWAPAAAYLLIIGETVPGIFLFVYGVVVISMIDNYARPLVIDRSAHLNPAVVLIGVFGGVYGIGITGVFIGPIVLAVLAAMLTTFSEDYDSIGETTG